MINHCPGKLVSVIFPIYRTPKQYLIESVNSLKIQSHRNFECLIIDDYPEHTDPEFISKLLIEDERFIYLPRESSQKMNLASALNYGIMRAKGAFIARFDSDDICKPNRFENQLQFFSDNPKVDILGTSINIIDSQSVIKSQRKFPTEDKHIKFILNFLCPICHPSIMFRSEIISRNMQLYDENFSQSEDLELWLRLKKAGYNFANLKDNLIDYRELNEERSRDHWLYNIKARRKNLDLLNFSQYFVIPLLFLFAYFPSKIKVFFISFKNKLLK